jgi:hypothetical protein
MFELDGVEQDVESFKKVNKLIDIDGKGLLSKVPANMIKKEWRLKLSSM